MYWPIDVTHPFPFSLSRQWWRCSTPSPRPGRRRRRAAPWHRPVSFSFFSVVILEGTNSGSRVVGCVHACVCGLGCCWLWEDGRMHDTHKGEGVMIDQYQKSIVHLTIHVDEKTSHHFRPYLIFTPCSHHPFSPPSLQPPQPPHHHHTPKTRDHPPSHTSTDASMTIPLPLILRTHTYTRARALPAHTSRRQERQGQGAVEERLPGHAQEQHHQVRRRCRGRGWWWGWWQGVGGDDGDDAGGAELGGAGR